MSNVLIIGGGVIGLCTADYATRQGHRVTLVDRVAAGHGVFLRQRGYGFISHFIPLAAPGMVARGLKWMGNPESPFYIKPRLNWDLLSWGFKFWRAASGAQSLAPPPCYAIFTSPAAAASKSWPKFPATTLGW
jgi:D-amino-acid dehydrogenase